uniref:Sorting nexin-14-like n=1 Tax=Labrus bergylta TaxID=56723 RepID=A0A3Q3FF62_9LABR
MSDWVNVLCVLFPLIELHGPDSLLNVFCAGTFADTQLPSKRLIGPKNYEFLVSKREEFEEYLQRLLQHPELSNSQLLADFLSPHSVESQFLDRMLPDVNLGKIFKSVPGKLMKEKGQNLEPFIQSFFNSCESPKPKPSRPELTILSPTTENNKKLFTDLFKNNANLTEISDRRHNLNCFMEKVSVNGMYDCMMYVGRVVFHTSDWLHHVLAAGRILFKNTFEAYMDQYMQSKLEHVLQEHHMVSLITQLRDAVFCESSVERTTEDKKIRAKQTFEEMMKYLPDDVRPAGYRSAGAFPRTHQGREGSHRGVNRSTNSTLISSFPGSQTCNNNLKCFQTPSGIFSTFLCTFMH